MRILKRMLMVVAVAALLALMLSISASIAFAADPGDPKTACKGDGFLGFVDPETGLPFATQGQCVSFVEGGGTLVPVEITS
jgi:hypothetical protein